MRVRVSVDCGVTILNLKKKKTGQLKEIGKYLSAPGAQNEFYFPPGVKAEWLKRCFNADCDLRG
jgi:hypothetical protein